MAEQTSARALARVRIDLRAANASKPEGRNEDDEQALGLVPPGSFREQVLWLETGVEAEKASQPGEGGDVVAAKRPKKDVAIGKTGGSSKPKPKKKTSRGK